MEMEEPAPHGDPPPQERAQAQAQHEVPLQPNGIISEEEEAEEEEEEEKEEVQEEEMKTEDTKRAAVNISVAAVSHEACAASDNNENNDNVHQPQQPPLDSREISASGGGEEEKGKFPYQEPPLPEQGPAFPPPQQQQQQQQQFPYPPPQQVQQMQIQQQQMQQQQQQQQSFPPPMFHEHVLQNSQGFYTNSQFHPPQHYPLPLHQFDPQSSQQAPPMNTPQNWNPSPYSASPPTFFPPSPDMMQPSPHYGGPTPFAGPFAAHPVASFHPYPPMHQNPPPHAQAFAAGAAWAAAQIAQAAADYAAAGSSSSPWMPGWPPPPQQQQQPQAEWYPPTCIANDAWEEEADPSVMTQSFESEQMLSSHPPYQQHSTKDDDESDKEEEGQEDHALQQQDRSFQLDRHRRKRQQRLPPSREQDGVAVDIHLYEDNSYNHNNHNSNKGGRPPEREKIRRRLRSEGESSSSGSSFYYSNTGGSFFNNLSASQRPNRKKTKQYQSDDTKKRQKYRWEEMLLGKTAVSALYEWCSKRQRTPIFESGTSFQEDKTPIFEYTVSLDHEDRILGRGRGVSKGSAKQRAARQAMELLVPGVVFDEISSAIIELPPPAHVAVAQEEQQHPSSVFSTKHSTRGPPLKQRTYFSSRHAKSRSYTASEAAAEADDLAPNLVRLAIGFDQTSQDHEKAGEIAHDSKSEINLDQLHVSENPKSRASSLSFKRSLDATLGASATTTSGDEEGSEVPYYDGVGSSRCTRALHQMANVDPRIIDLQCEFVEEAYQGDTNGSATYRPNRRSNPGLFSCTVKLRMWNKPDNISNSKHSITETNSESSSSISLSESKIETTLLEMNGIGRKKTEARGQASAHMLQTLFPECKSLAEVFAAVDQMRKRKNKKSGGQQGRLVLAVPKDFYEGSRRLPQRIAKDLADILQGGEQMEHHNDQHYDEKDVASCQANWHKQIDAQIDKALYALNEQDEEGRSLPKGFTENDVGRTVLRKATELSDLERIEKLFLSCRKPSALSKASRLSGTFVPNSMASPEVEDMRDDEKLSVTTPSLSTNIVLLLCRAIAPYEDPPLGCAVLTLGFSMEHGRLLRVVEMANEPHLPQERFRECLEDFAKCMKYKLLFHDPKIPKKRIVAQDELKAVLKAHIDASNYSLPSVDHARPRLSSPLQVVKEESEISDASCEIKREANRKNKSSKRTRVA